MPELTALHSSESFANAASPDREASLIERLKRHDSNAFQEFVDLHGDSIRNLIGRLMAFEPEMDDVLQNTLIQVWRKIGSFRNQSSLKTWVTRIAIQQTRNHQRSVRRWMRRLQDRWKLETQGRRDLGTPEDPRWEKIQIAMQQMPYREREILVLVYLQGNTVQELAGVMNEKTNTLEVRLHRAKKALKRTIETAGQNHE